MIGSPTPSVLIAGAGPVGLTAALELVRRGASVRIVDDREGPSVESKAAAINARTLEIFESSGMTDRLLADGLPIRRAHLHYECRRVVTLDFGNLPHRYPFILSLPQSRTEELLIEALGEAGAIVERPVRLAGFEQSGDAVAARLEASSGRTETVTVDYLVGADGAHSTVRGGLDLGFTGEQYPGRWSLADVDMTWRYGTEDANLFMHADGRVLFVIAFGGGRYRLVSDTESTLDLLPEGSRVSGVTWESDFSVSLRQVEDYGTGRVFLCGDAAHIHSPAAGRGMNLGIEDAAVLARLLVEGQSGQYTRRRHFVGRRAVRRSDQLFQMASIAGPVGRRVRNLLLRWIVGRPLVQRMILRDIMGLRSPDRTFV